VYKRGERFTVIEEEADLSHSITIVHPRKNDFSAKEISQLPHDFILSKFRMIDGRDKPFSNFFPKAHDGRDNSSPDIIYQEGGLNYIMEVGTTLGDVRKYYNKKQETYQDAIQVRCGANWIYLIMIVGRNEIMTNFPITMDDAEDIFARFSYGSLIKQRVKDIAGNALDLEDKYAEVKAEIEMNLFDEINKDDVDVTDFLFVSEETLKEYDETEIPKYLHCVLEDAKEDFMTRTSENFKEFPIDDHIEKMYKSDGLRMDKKAVVPFPMFWADPVPETTSEYVDKMQPIENCDGPYGKLWTEIRLGMHDMFHDDEINDNIKNFRTKTKANYNINTAKKFREDDFTTRGRVKISMEFDDQIFFAERGLRGKKYSKFDVLQEKRKETKKGFHWDTDTSDIEKFINRVDLFDVVDTEPNPLENSLEPFYNQYFSKIESVSAEKFKQFLRTKIGRMLTIMSSTASELNLNIRKPTKGNEWIITYNRLFGFPIAMKNTGSNKHSFFTMLIRKDDMRETVPLPFSELIDLGNYYCSPLLSTRNHDLSMMVGIMTKFLSTYLIFTDIAGEKPEISKSFRFNQEILSALLIMTENKEKTSSPLQNIRYMYMDLLTTIPTNSDPFKVITKFDNILRNRLILFFMKKMVTAFKIMLNNKKSQDILVAQNVFDNKEDSDSDDDSENPEESQVKIPASQDQVSGMISFISMKSLKTYEEALNLSYMGVFHEKDKNEENQGFWKIFSKIMKEEIKMRPSFCDKKKMGYKSNTVDWNIPPSEFKSHEFSVPHVKMIGRTIKAKISNSGLTDSGFKDLILTKLSQVCYQELATFKASAEYTAFTTGDLPFFGYESKKRRKCLSAILDLMDEIGAQGRCPFTSFQKLFKLFKIHGGLIANLFKKNQLTGIREIFVLYIHARVVVNFLETVSRAICELMPNEYLTKGTEKLNAITNHYNKVASESRYRIAGKQTSSETVSDSADATTWCQRFVMPVFSVMFHEIFGETWKSMDLTLQSILNEFTFKRLEMPKKLLDMIFEHQEIYSQHDDGMNEFQKQFLQHDTEFKDLNNGFSMFLKNRSNFMQGILHYTSSLIHSGHLMLFSKWLEKLTEYRFGKEVKIITTTLCSSDDATRISTIIFKRGNPLEHKKILMFLIWTSSLLRASYPLFTALLSNEKSTLANLTKVSEFNSVWFFRNTMLTPKIKWSFAAMQYKTSSSTVERQLQDHNLINDLIANGCSTLVANDIQFLCLVNHYDCLGSMTMKPNTFYQLAQEISTLKHPIGWFYFLSNEKISTTLGYQFTKYWNLRQFVETRKCEVLSRKSLIGETSDIGGKSYNVKMRVGDSHKYYKFINEEIKVDIEEIENKIKENPEFMFRQSNYIEEEKMKIVAKAHAPGAEKSFSFDSGSKQHSMASYISNKPCITVSTKEEKFKCSLAYLTDYLIYKISYMDDSDFQYSYAQFPQMDLYNNLLDRLEKLVPVNNTLRNRRIKMKIRLPKTKIENLSPLKEVLGTLWFDLSLRTSRAMYQMSLESYRIEFTWIRETFEESLRSFIESFGEISIMEFISFILNSEERDPTVEFLIPGRKKVGAINTLIECFSKNYGRRLMLTRIDRRKHIRTVGDENTPETLAQALQNELDLIETTLARGKTLYNEHSRKLVMRVAMDNQTLVSLDDLNDDLVSKIDKKSIPLLLMTCVEKMKTTKLLDSQKLVNLYKRLNMGMLAWYKQAQKKIGNKYVGDGLVDVVLPTASFTLRIRDDTVLEIFASQKGKVNYYSTELCTLITKTLGLKTRQEVYLCDHFSASFEAVGLMGKYRENSPRGTPIRPMKENVMIPDELHFKVDLNKAGDAILKFKAGDKLGDSLRFSPKPKETSIPISIDDLNSYENNWMNNRAITPHSFKNLLDDAESSDETRDWLTVCINSRLMGMNESVNNKTALEFNMSTEIDYNMELTMDFGEVQTMMDDIDLLNMGMDINLEDLGMAMDESILDSESFIAGTDFLEIENPELFGYSRVVRPTARTSYYFSCRTFDNIIYLYKKKYGKKLSEMYSTGYTDKVKDDALRLVKLLGMKPEELYIELSEDEEDFDF
jgi:hypothetical protein